MAQSSEGSCEAVLKASLDSLDKLRKKISIGSKGTTDLLSLEQELKRLPSPEEVNGVLAAAREGLSKHIAAEKERLRGSFDPVLTQYLAGLKEANAPHRIVSQYHVRVGPLTLEAAPERLSARFLFNDQPVADWTMVSSVDDYRRMASEAKARLEEEAMPDDLFAATFLDAVGDLSLKAKGEVKLVRIMDAYPEITVQRVRRDLVRTKGKGPVKVADYPFCAFLYNLDRYKSALASLPQEKQVTFHTGGQEETGKYGVTLNGLDPEQPYKRFCYVTRR